MMFSQQILHTYERLAREFALRLGGELRLVGQDVDVLPLRVCLEGASPLRIASERLLAERQGFLLRKRQSR